MMQFVPGIGCKLPHTERNTPLLRIDIEHNAIYMVADVYQLGRVLHALRPSHLADVNKSLNPLLQFDKCSVVGNAYDFPTDMCAHRVPMLGIQPWVRGKLLESQ